MLQELPNIWLDSFAMIVVFTRLPPCEKCAEAIRKELGKADYNNAEKVVVYNSEPSLKFQELLDRQRVELPFFMKDDIITTRICG